MGENKTSGDVSYQMLRNMNRYLLESANDSIHSQINHVEGIISGISQQLRAVYVSAH